MIQVKTFEHEIEDELSDSINDFIAINEDIKVIDIKFSNAITICEEEQLYSFSALLIYST